jgi:hypothetical protein
MSLDTFGERQSGTVQQPCSPVIDGFSAAFGRFSPDRGPLHRLIFWVTHWTAFVLTVVASVRAYVSPAYSLSAFSMTAIALSSSFLVVAPFLVLRQHRFLCELLFHLAPRLIEPHRSEVERHHDWLEPYARFIALTPIVLVLWVYLASSNFFGDALGLGTLPQPFALLTVAVLVVGGLSAGLGVSAAVRSLVLCVIIARVPDEWEPFTETAGHNAESLARFATTSSRYFSIAGATLLPGVVAVSAGVSGGGFFALFAIAMLIGIVAAALLVVPAWAIHRGSTRDKAEFVRKLSDEIKPLADALMGDSRRANADAKQNYYRLRTLLEIRLQVVSQQSSPATIELLRRSPVTIVAPALAIYLRLI